MFGLEIKRGAPSKSRRRRLPRGLLGLLAAILALGCIGSAYASTIIEQATLKVKIQGWSYNLEAVIARPANAAGRLPLVLLTHGQPRDKLDRPRMHVDLVTGQARDMAERGWLAVGFMRRGYGASDGPYAETYECSMPNAQRILAAAAEDVAAVYEVVSQRPDVDTSRVLGMGWSAGGASMLAWAATQPTP